MARCGVQKVLPLAMEAYFEYPLEQMVSPSNERNKEPILHEVRNLVEGWEHLKNISILEVASGACFNIRTSSLGPGRSSAGWVQWGLRSEEFASTGTGQHVAFLAEALPKVSFIHSDLEPGLISSIHAWTADMPNVERAIILDAGAPWESKIGDRKFQMIIASNLTQISPWPVTLGLLQGAKEHLHTGGILFLYGPFLVDGRPTTQSNAQFNESMKDLNPEWGLRYVLALRPRPIHEGSDPEWDLRYALALCPRPVHEEFNPRVAPAVWPCAMS